MPCPLFEPREKIPAAPEFRARLPLIFEFKGICHAAAAEPLAEYTEGSAHSAACCNQGNAKGICSKFPSDLPVSAIRFDVTTRTPLALTVLVMEEENYWPRTWNKFDFVIAEQRLEPEIEDICRRAQVFHFCRSYLEKF
jgi:hypothetical protein